MADSNGKGFLTKSGFFIALKLVALVQAGKDATSVNLSLDVPPPRMVLMISHSFHFGLLRCIHIKLFQGDPNRATPVASTPPLVPAVTPGSDWVMKPAERLKYDQLFDSLNPMNGFIPGNKVPYFQLLFDDSCCWKLIENIYYQVKGLLMDSKLPVDTLGKIWDLADLDKDGSLDRHEFAIVIEIIYLVNFTIFFI